MDQLKFSLGPYELFSSILAGAPLLLAGFLLYRPISGLRELVPLIKENSSFSIAVTIILCSYLLGGLSSGITWTYFLFVCRFFRVDYSNFGRVVLDKMAAMKPDLGNVTPASLEFEDRLAYLLLKKVGSIENLGLLDTRLIPYLRLHSLPTISVVESYLALHIMFRALSLGFLILSVVLTANIFRAPARTAETLMLPVVSVWLSFFAFRRSVSFRKWRFREILLSFYYLANGEQPKPGA